MIGYRASYLDLSDEAYANLVAANLFRKHAGLLRHRAASRPNASQGLLDAAELAEATATNLEEIHAPPTRGGKESKP